jgi:methylmalonyl-CoA mutase N-terminal domain/subunit
LSRRLVFTMPQPYKPNQGEDRDRSSANKAALKPVETTSGIPVDAVYGRDAQPLPGEFPYTRGIQPDMYRGRLWTMRQYAGMGDAEESNRRFRFLLEHGAHAGGLSVAFDLPTQLGYDSDAPESLGEVGRAGVAIDSIEDMQRLFDAIPLDQVSTSMTINATATILLAMYAVAARRGGVAIRGLRGTVQNDILKEYVARGTYIYPVHPAMRLTTDLMAWAAQEMPAWNSISVSGYHLREAGATAVQELAFTLADGIAYVAAAVEAGLAVDSLAPRISFFFNAHSDLFEEVAKFRAARRMWAGIMRDGFDAQDARSWMMRFHTQTAGSTLTAAQPENNIVRTTLQALAGVLGGTQSLHANGFDEALALPTEASARLALRTQQVIAHESGVTATADPLAGSYYVEHLTDELERRARTILERIAGFSTPGLPSGASQWNRPELSSLVGRIRHGMVRAVENGYVQRQIAESAFAHQLRVERGDAIVVGVNRYTDASELVETPTQRLDPDVERRQVERLRALRLRRDAARSQRSLRALDEAVRNGQNVMPAMIEAVDALATVGEIADCLRAIFGEYRESVTV